MLKTLLSDVFGKNSAGPGDEISVRGGTSDEKADFLDGTDRIRIVILGAGGSGNNTVNRLSRIGISGAELVACNTDAQDLRKIDEGIKKVLIGEKLTRGLGAGGFPDIGEKSAEASREKLAEVLEGTHLLFLTAGMGGGTGTGSAPVIAEIAKEQGAIVVGVVTFPFNLERARLSSARAGIGKLRDAADTVIVIDNNKLLQYVPNLPIDKAFLVADEIVSRAVKGITETLLEPSLINLDFADLKAVLGGGKVATISIGEGEGPKRVEIAVKNAMQHPLLDVDYTGASGALVHVTGGADMTIGEVNTIGKLITKDLRRDANVMWGARICENLSQKLQIFNIMTGVKSANILGHSQDVPRGLETYTPAIEDWEICSI